MSSMQKYKKGLPVAIAQQVTLYTVNCGTVNALLLISLTIHQSTIPLTAVLIYLRYF